MKTARNRRSFNTRHEAAAFELGRFNMVRFISITRLMHIATTPLPPVLPDMNFVWGSKFRDVLTGLNGYRPETVVITGKVKEQIERSDSKCREGYWLYASQPLRNGTLREQILLDVCRAASDGFEIVIRPHPAEKFDDYFNEIKSSLGQVTFESSEPPHFFSTYQNVKDYS